MAAWYTLKTSGVPSGSIGILGQRQCCMRSKRRAADILQGKAICLGVAQILGLIRCKPGIELTSDLTPTDRHQHACHALLGWVKGVAFLEVLDARRTLASGIHAEPFLRCGRSRRPRIFRLAETFARALLGTSILKGTFEASAGAVVRSWGCDAASVCLAVSPLFADAVVMGLWTQLARHPAWMAEQHIVDGWPRRLNLSRKRCRPCFLDMASGEQLHHAGDTLCSIWLELEHCTHACHGDDRADDVRMEWDHTVGSIQAGAESILPPLHRRSTSMYDAGFVVQTMLCCSSSPRYWHTHGHSLAGHSDSIATLI